MTVKKPLTSRKLTQTSRIRLVWSDGEEEIWERAVRRRREKV